MKAVFFSFLFITCISFANPQTLKLDPVQAKIEWVGGKKIGSNHNGSINLKSGEIQIESNKIVSGKITIDMSSINVLDIPASDSNNAKLKGHLESDDFFGSKNHPEATLIIKNIKYSNASKADVSGDLTIKGKTHPISFPIEISNTASGLQAKGKMSVDRIKYDIKYNSADFFNLPVDKIINNTFDISFNVLAKK